MSRATTFTITIGKRRPRGRRQRGVALLAAMVALGMVAVIAYDFASTTNITATSAYNQRDAVRAHYLARSALNLSELVIRLQQKMDGLAETLGPIQITDYADQLMLAFCGSSEEVQAAVGMPTDQLKGMGADIGVCGVEYFDTEDDKINLNCANNSTAATALGTRIEALTFFPAYDPIFQESTADDWRRDRQQQAAALIDYVDKDRARFGQPGTAEDYGYENLKDDYKAKDNYIDSIGELRLVRGVDDRFWDLFGSAFTVYGACKSNVSALKDVGLIASIIYLAAENKSDPVIQDPSKLWMLANVVAKARTFGFYFAKTSEFVDFVKDPAAAMGAAAEDAAQAGGGSTSSSGGTDPLMACCNIPPGTKIGVELEQSQLDQIATAGARRTYRVRAYGEVDRKALDSEGNPIFPPVRRVYEGVWDTKVQVQNGRNNTPPQGAWVFLKEE